LYRVFQRFAVGPALILADSLPNKSRGVLVRMGIPHVVSGIAIYAPELGIAYGRPLTDTSVSHETNEKLLPLGLKVIAWFLLKPDFFGEAFTLVALQKRMMQLNHPVSLSTLSRVFRQLEGFELIRVSGGGRTRSLCFEERNAVWKKLLQLEVETIARRVEETFLPPDNLNWVYSGDSALAKISELSEPKVTTIATSISNYRKWKENEKKSHTIENWGQPVLKIELWREDPTFLSQDQCINPIELVLSLRKENDPRIRLVVAEVLDNYKLHGLHGEPK
jgi:hypothetical protein